MPNRITINTENAPAAIGTYSQAVKVNNTVYLSGQIPLIPETMALIGDDIEKQIRQVFNNLSAVCEESGGSLQDIVKLNIYLIDLSHFDKVNEIMAQYFETPYPARAAIGISQLPKGDLEPELVNRLVIALGAEFVLPPDDINAHYFGDWVTDQPHCPSALILPADSTEVSQALAICNEFKQPIVIQGGLTGVTDGSTPKAKEIALSLERLKGVERIDKNSLTIDVKAGTPLKDIHQALEGTGLIYGVDYGARQFCQIGGNVSTNAGGTQVIHYGMTREQVLGLRAILADGTIIDSMNHLIKNNAGYDLKQLFIGSEGTLGVITDLVLKLRPETTSRCTGLFVANNYQDILILLNLCRATFGSSLHAVEVMWSDYYDRASKEIDSPIELTKIQEGNTEPFIYALIEIRGRDKEQDHTLFQTLFEQCLEQKVIVDGAIAENDQDAEQIWQIRYAVKSLLKTIKAYANFDIGISINKTEQFIQHVKQALQDQFKGIETLFFGHIGDGNLHIIATTGKQADIKTIYEIVYPICAQYQGTISAEHGIGQQKKETLSLCRTKAEINLMKTLKHTMDPNHILNSGRIFDLD